MPKVSVLIPLYKTQESHLREAIESILNQTYTDFELLLLDDCPEDDRAAVVAQYADPRIRYAKNEQNLGISPTRNKLIDMAQGEYLAVMDHDDISLPERFAKQVAYLDAHPEVGVISSSAKMMVSGTELHHPESDAEIRIALMGYCSIIHSACMLRKSLLTQHGIRYEADLTPCEDYDIFCKLIPHTRFHNIPEVLFCYRDHADNTSHRWKSRMQEVGATITFRVRLENPTLYDFFLQSAKRVTRVKLFGFLPILKIVAYKRRERAWLFGFIPFWEKKLKATLPLYDSH